MTARASGPGRARAAPPGHRRYLRAAAGVGRRVVVVAWRRVSTHAGDAAGVGWAVRATHRVVSRLGARRIAIMAGAAAVALCCLPLAGTVVVLGAFSAVPQATVAACPVAGAGDEAAALDAEQRGNAELIVAVGMEQVAAPPRAWVIAVATAMQESGLRNLPHQGERNDYDSVGLFQQRPSRGWGSAEQLLDPVYAATAFYRALLEIEDWQQLSLTQAAQAVQRSAFPDAYARHEPLAVALVNEVTGGAVGAAAADHDLRCAQWHEVTAAGWTVPAPGPVWSGFRTANRPEHYGVDIGAPRHEVVRSAADGQVILVACNAIQGGEPVSCDVDGSPNVVGCGWYVNIMHAGNVVTRYCHLARRPDVAVGQQVVAGQPIGLVGSSGHSSGPHLHFEVELAGSQRAAAGVLWQRRQTDPVAFLATRGVSLECTGTVADCTPVHGDRVRVVG